jgi:hypothetical protein
MGGFSVALGPERGYEQICADAISGVIPVQKIVRFQNGLRVGVDHAFLQQLPGT